jgi:hypothetical protein
VRQLDEDAVVADPLALTGAEEGWIVHGEES